MGGEGGGGRGASWITLKNLILKNDEEVEHPLYVHLFNAINPIQLLCVCVCVHAARTSPSWSQCIRVRRFIGFEGRPG